MDISSKSTKQNWFAKHKVLTGIIGIILVIIIVTSTNHSKTTTPAKPVNNTSPSNTAPQNATKQPQTTASTQAPAARKVSGTATTVGAGSFTGGKDVAVGLYDVTAPGQSGNFSVTGTNTYNEILGTDATQSEVPTIRVKISSGDQISVSGLNKVIFTPVTAAYVTAHAAANLYAGTFTVGQDIGAGRYVVKPGSGQSGNFSTSGGSSYNEILGSDSSLDEVPSLTVTLNTGDVIAISGMSQVTFTPSN